jgi:NADH-quinone oxidoreductase subunit C
MEEKKVLDELKKKFPDKVLETSALFGDETARIGKEALLEILESLRKPPFEFTMLLDLTCVDFPGRAERLEMVYHLFSIKLNRRLRIKVSLPEHAAAVDSLTCFWKNAEWLEREVFDMFGIRFEGHPDLRRLFLYDGFEGYPLRKDYPLRKRQPKIPLKT